ncbi:MAG: hypothetical protein SWH54_08565 [Thermodesulfobacteriota bacterium]|nr:hypothetical protein [Thermodesulfobacteriota bacterium]
MVDKSKRDFCTRYFLRQIGEIIEGFEAGVEEAKQKEDFDNFFKSYESSYALTLAYPDEILLETAKSYGIETEGRGKNEIVKELLKKKGGY